MRVEGMDDLTREPQVSIRALAPEDAAARAVVKEAMIVAGEVAARWGHERKIPLLYRCETLAPCTHLHVRMAALRWLC